MSAAFPNNASPQVPVLQLENIGVVRDSVTMLAGVSLEVMPGQHWIVLGANGSGKSTLLGVAGLDLHPSTGRAVLLGQELGRVDIRPLRGSVGVSSAFLAQRLRSGLQAGAVVYCGRYGALEPWWHSYSDADRERSSQLLGMVGLDGFDSRSFGSLSSGERQRILLARALFNDPALLLLDEPNAGLDPGAREALVEVQVDLAHAQPTRASILVTHHVEDIPPSATHLLALAEGEVVTAGPIDSVLSGSLISALFGVSYRLEQHEGRWLGVPGQ
jgi:iron complex transport system ATP-binding protein